MPRLDKAVLLAAGRHYLARMGRPTGVSEAALMHTAIRTLGLSELKPFDVNDRVIEYRLSAPARLASMSVRGFVDELASDSPAPGGGSVSALTAAMAAGLAAMVAVLSHTRKGFESKQSDLDRIAVRAQALKDMFLAAVDADTECKISRSESCAGRRHGHWRHSLAWARHCDGHDVWAGAFEQHEGIHHGAG